MLSFGWEGGGSQGPGVPVNCRLLMGVSLSWNLPEPLSPVDPPPPEFRAGSLPAFTFSYFHSKVLCWCLCTASPGQRAVHGNTHVETSIRSARKCRLRAGRTIEVTDTNEVLKTGQ